VEESRLASVRPGRSKGDAALGEPGTGMDRWSGDDAADTRTLPRDRAPGHPAQ
jgi:hypothetical protein